MSIRARAVVVPGLVLACAMAIAGCGGSTTSPGAAALVGDTRIPVSTLQHAVDRALADPQAAARFGGNRAAFTRLELGRLIENVLVSAAAAAHHVSATATAVDQQIAQFAQQAGGLPQLQQQASQGGVPKQDLRSFIRYYVLQTNLVEALAANVPVSQADLQRAYQQNIDQFDQVHVAHILVKDKATADGLLQRVRSDPGSFATLVQRYSIDTASKPAGGDLGFVPRSKLDKSFAAGVWPAKPGTFVVVHSQFGWHVVHVIAHRTVPLAQATPQLKASLLRSQAGQLLQQALSAQSKQLGVHVNPRYGRWDAANGQVVSPSPNNDVSSPAPTSSGSG